MPIRSSSHLSTNNDVSGIISGRGNPPPSGLGAVGLAESNGYTQMMILFDSFFSVRKVASSVSADRFRLFSPPTVTTAAIATSSTFRCVRVQQGN